MIKFPKEASYGYICGWNNRGICRSYLLEFEEIRSGNFGALYIREQIIPWIYNLNGVPIRILFSPDDSPELKFIKQILKCKKCQDYATLNLSFSYNI